jgi:hypothetical protein
LSTSTFFGLEENSFILLFSFGAFCNTNSGVAEASLGDACPDVPCDWVSWKLGDVNGGLVGNAAFAAVAAVDRPCWYVMPFVLKVIDG